MSQRGLALPEDTLFGERGFIGWDGKARTWYTGERQAISDLSTRVSLASPREARSIFSREQIRSS